MIGEIIPMKIDPAILIIQLDVVEIICFGLIIFGIGRLYQLIIDRKNLKKK